MAALLLGLQQPAQAIGVGRPQTLSALGQPLQLLFPVRLSAGETLNPDCVRAEVLAGDTRLPGPSLQIQLEGESESSVRAVRLQSVLQIDEPLVTVSLSLGCPAKLVRQYTAFIDPPGANPSLTVQAQPAVVVRNYSPQLQAALSTAEARPAALLAPAQAPLSELPGLAPSERQAAPSTASARRAEPAVAAPAKPVRKSGARSGPRAPGKAKPPRRDGRPVEASSGPRPSARLQLEPAASVLAVASAAASAPASSASAPDMPDPAIERFAKLEQGLAKLQTEQRVAQEQMQTLRRQLERAQAERYQNPLIYGLGLMVLALGGAAWYFWRSRQEERRLHESAWWSEVKHEVQADRAERPQSARVVPAVAPAPTPTAEQQEEHTIVLPGLQAEVETEAPTAAPASAASAPPLEQDDEPVTFQLIDAMQARAPAAASSQRVSVEDLIDLEQQADFFIVLGQEDAAVELLSSRIDGAAADAVLPYLKLLHLHQRAGRREAFEALARRYGERFALTPPDWSQDLDADGGLEARPELMAKIQRRWTDSAACMALLQAVLVGQADRSGLPEPLPVAALDLASLADLLMLYGVARDLSEHEVRGDDIDLFLPLDAPATSPAAGMMATMVWQPPASALTAPHALEVDISLDEPEPTQPDTKP